MSAVCDMLNVLIDMGMQFAFIGTVSGLLMFGIMKIWSIVSPENANQLRDFFKNLGLGLVLVSGATAIARWVFLALGFTVQCIGV